jgi:hypothetical protein
MAALNVTNTGVMVPFGMLKTAAALALGGHSADKCRRELLYLYP